MPVVGLPTAVEATLQALLSENQLSSWKIASQGTATTVVFRLTSTTSNNNTDAIAQGNDTQKTTVFRKKPPSQQRRDQQRYENRKTNRKASASIQTNISSCKSHFVEAETQVPNIGLRTVSTSTDLLLTDILATETPARADRAVNTDCDIPTFSDNAPVCVSEYTAYQADSAIGCMSELSADSDVDARGSVCASDIPGETPQYTNRDPVSVAVDWGYDMPHFRTQLRKVKDRTVHDNLCSMQRNNRFSKIVLDKRGDNETLVGETDDMIMLYNCKTTGACFWYVKQDLQKLAGRTAITIVDEHVWNVQRWPPADHQIYGSQFDELYDHLGVVTDAVRYLLT